MKSSKITTKWFVLTLLAAAAGAEQREIPPAYGPHTQLAEKDFAGSKSFRSKDRLVFTYYFYWYDVYSGAHVTGADGHDMLTTHPPTLDGFSYKSVQWHKQQLTDMMEAGIDVVLPVFWGAPSEQQATARLHWSYAGLKPLVEAREALLREGRKPPYIGLFYDTSTLQHNAWRKHIDLTTDYGQRWFYATIRDFFSLIPPKHWAMVDGQPFVFLYASAFAKNYDQSFVRRTKEEFAGDFAGRTPYIVREVSWQVEADSAYAWGGALGLKNHAVASLGPGYDHTAVRGRQPLIVEREGGKFYEDNWHKLLRRPPNLIAIETWNEFHEGTDICESKEYGRQYIELTRRYVKLFKTGKQPPGAAAKYKGAKSVAVTLDTQNQERGLQQIEHADGQTRSASAAGRPGRAIQRTQPRTSYVYLAVDDSFKWAPLMNLRLRVEYFDAAPGEFSVDYDGNDPSAPFNGAYTRCPKKVQLTGDKTWKTAEFDLREARFCNRQNSGTDFRLAVDAPEFVVGTLTLLRR